MYDSLTSIFPHAVVGAIAAAAIAGAAWKAGSLTGGGAFAAVVVGTAAFAAGWTWAGLLVFFFLSSTALTHIGAASKARRVGGRIEKAGARDALQVLANGGLFAGFAVVASLSPSYVVTAAALGALATATGDTWATEIGVFANETTRSILTWRPVPPGTSGGVTLLGSTAGIAGACAIAGGAAMFDVPVALAAAIAVGGTAGVFVDSVLGATVQSGRWCDTCGEATERAVHVCGHATRHARGWRWLTNDGVNALATCSGAAVACAMVLWGPAL